MNLDEICRQLISSAPRQLEPGHPLGTRLLSVEYSKSAKEIKTYPLLSSQRIFFLCWDFCGRNQLRAAMYPAPATALPSKAELKHSAIPMTILSLDML
mgnify:CR=1 FL=1